MKNKVLLSVLFTLGASCICLFAGAQTPGTKVIQSSGIVSCDTCRKAAPGTYEFIVASKKGTPVFTDAMLIEVELVRDETEVVYLQISPEVQVMIPPKSEIYAPGFTPLPELVYTN